MLATTGPDDEDAQAASLRPAAARYGERVEAIMPLFVLVAVAGALAQRHPRADRLRDVLWWGVLWISSPLVIAITVLTIDVARELVAALAVAVLSSWLVVAAAAAYGRAVGRTPAERGALALAGGFGNTASAGYPLAHLAFGPAGLPLAVLYDKLQFLVPPLGVSTVIARLHGSAGPERFVRSPRAALLVNPPLAAAAVALALRGAGVDATGLDGVATAAAFTGGAIGFVLLGLSLPLEPVRHDGDQLVRALGATAIRLGGGPLVLYLTSRATGVDVPGVFFLLAGMPSAFHLMTLARVYDVSPRLVRLLVVGTTVLSVACVTLASSF